MYLGSKETGGGWVTYTCRAFKAFVYTERFFNPPMVEYNSTSNSIMNRTITEASVQVSPKKLSWKFSKSKYIFCIRCPFLSLTTVLVGPLQLTVFLWAATSSAIMMSRPLTGRHVACNLLTLWRGGIVSFWVPSVVSWTVISLWRTWAWFWTSMAPSVTRLLLSSRRWTAAFIWMLAPVSSWFLLVYSPGRRWRTCRDLRLWIRFVGSCDTTHFSSSQLMLIFPFPAWRSSSGSLSFSTPWPLLIRAVWSTQLSTSLVPPFMLYRTSRSGSLSSLELTFGAS